jgi:hypothetical protein
MSFAFTSTVKAVLLLGFGVRSFWLLMAGALLGGLLSFAQG